MLPFGYTCVYCSRMATHQSDEALILDNIKSIKSARGTSDAHLIRTTGISRATFERRMRGEGSFTVRQVLAIAEALGATLSELATDPETMEAAA